MKNSLIEKIAQQANVGIEEVQKRINSKLSEFSGLVSEEGAVYLVAKDLGVDPSTEIQKKSLKIENIVPGMRSVSLKGKVVSISDINSFKKSDGSEGQVQNVVLGDETGTVRLSLWNDQIELADKLEINTAIEIKNAYSKEDNRGDAELRLGKKTIVRKIDSSEIPNVVTFSTNNIKKTHIVGVQHENVKYEVEGTILQIFTKNAFFMVCPSCGKRVTKNESNVYTCEEHGEVNPVKKLVISLILDDGTATIRCVFFENVAYNLIKSKDINSYEELENIVKPLLGKYIHVSARSKFNSFFNALELIVDNVKDIDVSEKLQNYVEVN